MVMSNDFRLVPREVRFQADCTVNAYSTSSMYRIECFSFSALSPVRDLMPSTIVVVSLPMNSTLMHSRRPSQPPVPP